jgi:hypothetical protein
MKIIKNMYSSIGYTLSLLYLGFCLIILFLAVFADSFWLLAINTLSIPTLLSGGLLFSITGLFVAITGLDSQQWFRESWISGALFYLDYFIHIFLNLILLNLLGYLVSSKFGRRKLS